MIFFTDITTNSSNYCLLNVKRYDDPKKHAKKLIFIDPSVYELKTQTEYSNIEKLHQLVSNHQENEYISIDYPCDMNITHSDLFIQKSIQNNWTYKENLHYICTIQYDWMVFEDFKRRMLELEPIWAHMKKIVGLGNMCRIMNPCKYLDDCFNWVCARAEQFYWIHIYGMSLACIRKYVPLLEYKGLKVSVDSTKWTRACTNQLKSQYGLNSSKQTRDLYFQSYIAAISRKIKVFS